VKDTAGQTFEITLSSGGAAKASRGEGMVGTWKEEGRSESRGRCRGRYRTFGEDNRVLTHARARAFLESVAKRCLLITYQELANALRILPPNPSIG
jgi:hypothetical protein